MEAPQYADVPQQPGEPAWVPYLNLVQGVRMDYPNTWRIQEQSTPFSFAAWFGSPQRGPQDPFQENLTITVQPVFAGTTAEALVQSWQTMATAANLHILEATAATLAGQAAYRVLFNTPPQPPSGHGSRVLLYLFLLNGKGYSAAYTGLEGDFDHFLPTVQQMLASLQVH